MNGGHLKEGNFRQRERNKIEGRKMLLKYKNLKSSLSSGLPTWGGGSCLPQVHAQSGYIVENFKTIIKPTEVNLLVIITCAVNSKQIQ